MINPDYGHEGRGSDGAEYDEGASSEGGVDMEGLDKLVDGCGVFLLMGIGAVAGTAGIAVGGYYLCRGVIQLIEYVFR